MAETTSTAHAKPGRFAAAAVLGVLVAGIVAVAFRGSWGALRDAALAAHFDRAAAVLYAFGVDGVIVVGVVAALVLRHQRGSRRYCLTVVGAYTGASWLLNFLHGIGMFATDPATGMRPTPPWYIVIVIASLVIGSIFLGSHLLVHVLRYLFPGEAGDGETLEAFQTVPPVSLNGHRVPAVSRDNVEAAKAAYRRSLDPDLKTLSQRDLVDRFGVSKRQAGQVQRDVDAESAETSA